jgi:hypothetical protein
VKEKPAEELIDRETHDALAVVVCGIAPPEGDVAMIYLVLMAQTTLDEWFGLYSSNTREIEMFAFKWSQRLHSSTSESRDEGGGKKIEKASSMLVWTGSTEKSVSLPRQPSPAAQQRDSGFASGLGLAARRDEMHGVTTPARPGKGSHG